MKHDQLHTLSNGINVLFYPRLEEDLVCSMIWVKAGYEHENSNILGVAHMLEHLFYRKKVECEDGQNLSMLECMRKYGAMHNAVTAPDHTHFYAVSSKEHIFSVISSQLQAVLTNQYDNEDLQQEKAIIFEELKKKLFDPHIQARESLLSMVFPDSAGLNQRSLKDKTIDLELKDIQSFHNKYYRPDNINLCIRGAIDIEVTIDYLESCLKNINIDYKLNDSHLGNEKYPPKKSEKKVSYKRLLSEHKQSFCKIGFDFPLDLKTMLVADLTAIVLGKGKSSILMRNLGHHAGSTVLHFEQKSVFLLEAECEPKDLAQTQETLLTSLYGFSQEMMSDKTSANDILQKAKNILYSNYYSQDLSMISAAYKSCYMYACLNHFSKDDETHSYLEVLKNIQLDDLRRFINDQLSFKNMKIIELVPKKLGHVHEEAYKLASLEKRVEHYLNKLDFSHCDVSETESVGSIYSKETLSSSVVNPPYRSQMFNNGAQLVYWQRPDAKMANLSIRFKGGRLEETFLSSGYTHACLGLLSQATMRENHLEFRDNIESKGIQLDHDASADHFGYSLVLPHSHLEQSLKIIADMIIEPYMSPQLLEFEKTKMLNQIAGLDNDLYFRPIELFYKALMGMHPYAWPRYGHTESIVNLDVKSAQSWHQEHFCLSNMVISYVGPASYAQVQETILSQFDLDSDPVQNEKKGVLSFMPPRSPVENIALTKGSQVGLVFGFKGVKYKEKNKFALDCLAYILSGLGGRLFNELRDKRALVYQSTAYNIALLKAGAFFVYTKTNTKHEEEVKNRILVEFERLKQNAVSQEELNQAIKLAICHHSVDLQASSSLAYLLAENAIKGESVETLGDYEQRIKKVHVSEVYDCANDIFDLDHSALGVLRGKN